MHDQAPKDTSGFVGPHVCETSVGHAVLSVLPAVKGSHAGDESDCRKL